jgi:hypothetical protein
MLQYKYIYIYIHTNIKKIENSTPRQSKTMMNQCSINIVETADQNIKKIKHTKN